MGLIPDKHFSLIFLNFFSINALTIFNEKTPRPIPQKC